MIGCEAKWSSGYELAAGDARVPKIEVAGGVPVAVRAFTILTKVRTGPVLQGWAFRLLGTSPSSLGSLSRRCRRLTPLRAVLASGHLPPTPSSVACGVARTVDSMRRIGQVKVRRHKSSTVFKASPIVHHRAAVRVRERTQFGQLCAAGSLFSKRRCESAQHAPQCLTRYILSGHSIAKVVGAPGLEGPPLGDWTSVCSVVVVVASWPASR